MSRFLYYRKAIGFNFNEKMVQHFLYSLRLNEITHIRKELEIRIPIISARVTPSDKQRDAEAIRAIRIQVRESFRKQDRLLKLHTNLSRDAINTTELPLQLERLISNEVIRREELKRAAKQVIDSNIANLLVISQLHSVISELKELEKVYPKLDLVTDMLKVIHYERHLRLAYRHISNINICNSHSPACTVVVPPTLSETDSSSTEPPRCKEEHL